MIKLLSSRRAVLVAAASLSFGTAARAGLMNPDYDLQTYRDFAANRGVFQAGATNVTIYKADGSVAGVIAVVPDFSGVMDNGSSTLVGASFGGSVAHMGTVSDNTTYAVRLNDTGLAYSSFGDTYKPVVALTPGNDVGLIRYSKLVIDAAPTPLLSDATLTANMAGRQIARVGDGWQSWALAPGVTANVSNYKPQFWLSGGLNTIDGQWIDNIADTVNDGVAKSYTSRSFNFNMDATPSAPLQIGTQAGDSGSPVYTWNTNTSRYEILAFNSSGSGSGIGKGSNIKAAPEWMQDMMASYDMPTIAATSGGGVVTLGVTNASGGGTLTQGATTWNYIGLASGVTSATATDAQFEATRSLVFAGAGNTVRLAGSVDLGAGTVRIAAGTYVIDDGGVTTRRFNTGGYIVESGASLTLKTTGSAGDDWRKIGAGTLRIEGTGNSAAKLSLGEGLVELNRTGGYAVDDVLITSGRGTVRLLAANQIAGDISFGSRGGTLDLYGTSLSRDVIYAMDGGAEIANTKANTTSTLTWTGSGSGLTQTFRGGFTDGGSLANGLLNVVIAPTTAAGSVLTLTGNSSNQGGYAINGGEVVLRGARTPHAGENLFRTGPPPTPSPDDWTYASIDTGTVTVASGAKFTLADHARLDGDVTVGAGGTFAITENLFRSTAESVEGSLPGTPSSGLYGHQSGSVTLNGATAAMIATVSGATDQSMTYSRNISGTGSFTKNGPGTLTLSGTNTFSGTKTLNDGQLLGTSLAALGDTTTNKWSVGASGVIGAAGATITDVRNKLATNASGTLAIMDDFAGGAPSLTGYTGLYLGSIDAHVIGTNGVNTTLYGWGGTSGSDYLFGGGGGTLTVNHKLGGSGALIAGNGQNTGVVILNRVGNYTGGTVVNSGVTLRTNRSDSLGSGTNNIAVNYGGAIAPGTGAVATAIFARIASTSTGVVALTGADANAYDFAAEGLDSLALGADGSATYSGTLTPGSAGYRFGGSGALTVASTLAGANALSADGQGTKGGVTTLSGNNTFTGAVTVQGGVVNGATGSHTLKLGSGTALGSVSNAVTLNDGAILDTNGRTAAIGALAGTVASSVENSSATAASLSVGSTTNSTYSGVISGAIDLTKTGSGTLTLSGDNTRVGTVSVNAGTLVLTGENSGTTATTIASGGTLQVGAGGATGGYGPGTMTNNGALTFYRNNSSDVAGAIAGSGSVTYLGTGVSSQSAYTIGDASTYSGGTTITLARAQLANGAGFGTGTVTVNAGGQIFTSSGDTLANNLVLNGNGWSESAGLIGALRIGTTATVSGNITLAGNTRIGTGGGQVGTITGVISGAYNLEVGGNGNIAGSTVFAGDNTYTGTTTISTGTLTVGDGATSGRLGTGAVVNKTTLIFNRTDAVTVANAISGAGSVTHAGTGALTLTGTNTHTGGTVITQGRLNATAASLGTGAITVGEAADYGATYASGATPFLNITDTGNATVANAIALPAPAATGYYAIQKAGGGSNLTLSGVISGGGANLILQLDSPTAGDSTTNFTLSGNNTFAGQVRLNRGYVTLGNANGAGTASIFLQSNANSSGNLRFAGDYTVNNAVIFGTTNNNAISSSGYNVTLAGTVSGGANWTKTGAGTLTLSGNNTYTGITTVNAGRLVAASNTAFGTGGVVAASGGTLSVGLLGAGRSLSNAITVNSGGSLAGSATLSGGVTLASGAAYVWQLAGIGGVAGTDFDRIVVSGGAFTLSGATLKIVAGGIDYANAYWNTSRIFEIVTTSGTGSITGAFGSVDTSGAGLFGAEGVWSLATGPGQRQQAVWTAGSALGSAEAVPEPSTYGLLGAGAMAAVALVRRRRKVK